MKDWPRVEYTAKTATTQMTEIRLEVTLFQSLPSNLGVRKPKTGALLKSYFTNMILAI